MEIYSGSPNSIGGVRVSQTKSARRKTIATTKMILACPFEGEVAMTRSNPLLPLRGMPMPIQYLIWTRSPSCNIDEHHESGPDLRIIPPSLAGRPIVFKRGVLRMIPTCHVLHLPTTVMRSFCKAERDTSYDGIIGTDSTKYGPCTSLVFLISSHVMPPSSGRKPGCLTTASAQ